MKIIPNLSDSFWHHLVIPAKAGVQWVWASFLDSGFRRNDETDFLKTEMAQLR